MTGVFVKRLGPAGRWARRAAVARISRGARGARALQRVAGPPAGFAAAVFGVFAVLATFVVLAALAAGGCAYLAPRSQSPGPAVEEAGIVFRFYAPSARRVQLAGDWPENNWARGDGSVGEANIGLMQDADGDGLWEITVPLAPGRYRYLFWVDENTWHLDPGNLEEVPGGPAGTCSALVLYGGTDDKLEIR